MRFSKKSIRPALAMLVLLVMLVAENPPANAQDANAKSPIKPAKEAGDLPKNAPAKAKREADKEAEDEPELSGLDKILKNKLLIEFAAKEFDSHDFTGANDLSLRTVGPKAESILLRVSTDGDGYLVATFPYPVVLKQPSAPLHLHADSLVVWVKKRPGKTEGESINRIFASLETMELYAEGHVWISFGAKAKRFTAKGSRAFFTISNGKPDIDGTSLATLRGVFDDSVAHTANLPKHQRVAGEGVGLGGTDAEHKTSSSSTIDRSAATGNLVAGSKADRVFALERGERIFIKSSRLIINNLTNQNGTRSDVSAEDPIVSRSSLAIPSFSFRAKRMRLQLSPTRNIASIEDPSVWVRSANIFTWPSDNFSHDLDSRFPIKRFSYGSSDVFGSTFRTKVNLVDAYDYLWDPDPTFRPFAFSPEFDYYSSRGRGYGVEAEYSRLRPFQNGFRSVMHAYFIEDSGDNRDVARDLGYFPLRRRQRGRVRGYAQGRVGDNYSFDGHINYQSDQTFVQEFFDDEFDRNDVDRTFLRLTRRWNGRAFYVGADVRARDFIDEVESLPVMGFAMHRERVGPEGAGLQLSTNGEIGLYRLHLNDSSHIHDGEQILRGDFEALVHRPFDFGLLIAEPFVGGRLTLSNTRFVAGPNGNPLFEEFTGFQPPQSDGVLEEDLVSRAQLVFGMNLQSNFTRTYAGAKSSFFDIDGLRHTITPAIRWQNTISPSGRESDFVQLDRIDSLSNFNRVLLSLRNRFQTRRRILGTNRNVDFADLLLEIPFYPNAERDNNGQRFGRLEVQARLRPHTSIAIDAGVFLDSRRFNWQRWYLAARTRVVNTDLTLFYRSLRNLHEIAGFTTDTRLSSTYSIGTELEYDFFNNDVRDMQLRVSRTFVETFRVDLNMRRDALRDNFSFSVSLSANFGPAVYEPEGDE